MADLPAAEAAEVAANTSVEEAPTFIELYAGNDLTGEDADAVTLRSPAHPWCSRVL